VYESSGITCQLSVRLSTGKPKPFNPDEMVLTVSRALEKANIERKNKILKLEVAQTILSTE
jgi:hypothetical protein